MIIKQSSVSPRLSSYERRQYVYLPLVLILPILLSLAHSSSSSTLSGSNLDIDSKSSHARFDDVTRKPLAEYEPCASQGHVQRKRLSTHEQQNIVYQVNSLRSLVSKGQVSDRLPVPKHPLPDLVWSDELARKAQHWADLCPASSQPYTPGMYAFGYSQAVAFGMEPELAVRVWFDGHKNVRHLQEHVLSCQASLRRHNCFFTQLVWQRTREIGCGLASVVRDDSVTELRKVFVCNFREPGNIVGEKSYETVDKGPWLGDTTEEDGTRPDYPGDPGHQPQEQTPRVRQTIADMGPSVGHQEKSRIQRPKQNTVPAKHRSKPGTDDHLEIHGKPRRAHHRQADMEHEDRPLDQHHGNPNIDPWLGDEPQSKDHKGHMKPQAKSQSRDYEELYTKNGDDDKQRGSSRNLQKALRGGGGKAAKRPQFIEDMQGWQASSGDSLDEIIIHSL